MQLRGCARTHNNGHFDSVLMVKKSITGAFGAHQWRAPLQARRVAVSRDKITKKNSYIYSFIYLCRIRTVRFVEQRPDLRFHVLPPGHVALVVVLLEAEFAGQLLIGRLLRVQIQAIQDRKRFLRVTML